MLAKSLEFHSKDLKPKSEKKGVIIDIYRLPKQENHMLHWRKIDFSKLVSSAGGKMVCAIQFYKS